MSSGSAAAGWSRRGRRNRHQALVSQDRWLVSYADFMTLLFAFFVVLFAASRHNNDSLGKLSGAIHSGFSGRASGPVVIPSQDHGDSGGRAGQPALAAAGAMLDLDALTWQLRGVLGHSIEKHEVSLAQTPDGLVISFEELGFFHSGEANLLPSQAHEIAEAGSILKQHGLLLRIEGHSDDQPIHNAAFSSNWELSAARAMAVLRLLVDQAQYDPTRLAVAGYGPYRPVAENTTAEGRGRNRRVDLVVVRDPPSLLAPYATLPVRSR